jgi:tRNA-splicing ligase RtcB
MEVVETIFDEEVADAFGLFPGQLVISIHCGSRGLGHQVCTDYVRDLQSAVKRYGITLPDRELVCAPMDSPEGKSYFGAMAAAANFAWANRQALAHIVCRVFEQVMSPRFPQCGLTQVYDVAHNIAKVEEHTVGGRKMTLCVHRKGATRSFPAGHPEVPAPYRRVGQPVLMPGDMGTASYIMVGAETSMDLSFGSAAHGAGRVLSRAAAKKQVRGENLKERLEAEGIVVRAGSMAGLAEEAPEAYKDIDRVASVVAGVGLARKVARLRPLGVIKG